MSKLSWSSWGLGREKRERLGFHVGLLSSFRPPLPLGELAGKHHSLYMTRFVPERCPWYNLACGSTCAHSRGKGEGGVVDIGRGDWKRSGVNSGRQIHWSVIILNLLTNQPLKFCLESEIWAKISSFYAKSKIRAQKLDVSAICCNCWIWKSVKILLRIWNLGKNIFKIHRSIGLFTSLKKGQATHFGPVEVGISAHL